MASLIAKRKKNKLYYYVVDSARVQGRPRIVHQTYLGSAEKVAALLKERTAPLPLSATRRELGLPGALWLAAQQSGVFALLQSLWGPPRSGPSPAHYLLLAAMHRICSPGPKTAVADWYGQTILAPLWGFEPERFSPQAFWDCFEQLLPEKELRRKAKNVTRWRKRKPACSACGRKSSSSAAACWLTTPPTFTPSLPPPTPAIRWRNAAITSRAGTIFAKWA